MSHAIMVAPALPRVPAVSLAANRKRRQRPSSKTPNKDQNQNLPPNPALGFGIKKKNPVWQCVQNCGACCKLDKGFAFPYPEEIFEDPSDIELYKSLVGPDGWCIQYEKSTRKCSIYADRPYFCRVEPGIFKELYGIDEKKFQKEACSSCVDTIKAVYGLRSNELDNFNRAIWSTSSQ
ncbi:uncharacterized protein LOC111404106 isoform X1 [Olea europaea var. sylvestris]|uniref:uncharacterized protein LOC111404106 isoform X1 n=1 Tax=Olea europaea var. sylvestris TaxID=158386 RepID=UPI000C1CEC02|nr:uncharacterized protein LOC111404106 isoform X1 [Olea europaea var. sylvestris]XP_022888613.1 uncharacterized protein LOC111404106 isoform X1 [Olea europaea var. sylvestris]XP_022888614.1 uncharacterized protein LOC111404106 isoform X1 [Olea europaea var. sylvestris]